MSDRHDDGLLEALSGTWREDQPPALDDLRREVRRSARTNRLLLLSELVVASAGVAAGVWLIWGGRWLLGAGAVLFGAFGLVVALVTRRAAPHQDLESVAGALDAAIEQAQRRWRVAQGGLWLCAAALLFLAAAGLAALGRTGTSLPGLVRLQAGGALFIAVALATVIVGLRRAGRRLARLTALRERVRVS